MSRRILFAALIAEAAGRGRLTLGPLGVRLDGEYVDEDGGHQVIDLIDDGLLVESEGVIAPSGIPAAVAR